jgi:hypothetical protein
VSQDRLFERADERLLSAIGSASRSVLLVSPFLSIRVAQRLAEVAAGSSAEWSLLTHLDPLAAAGRYLSIDGLRVLLAAGVKLGHVDRVHAKVCVADDFVMLGSANLINTGLGGASHPNVELSVELAGDAAERVRSIVESWRGSADVVGGKALDDLEARMRALPRLVLDPAGVESEPMFGTTADQVAVLVADARERNLWVKAQYGEPNPEQWREPHRFASSKRGRPSFKAGDLVLVYSEDAHASYAIVEVLDSAVDDPAYVVAQGYPEEDAARWPWVNTTKPRLVPSDGATVSPQTLGFTGQGLQGGHRRIGVSEFVDAVHALAGTRS